MARQVHFTDGATTPLDTGWEMLSTEAGRVVDPAHLTGAFTPALVPGTVASSLRESGAWSLTNAGGIDFDARDHWYRCRFRLEASGASGASGARSFLSMRGLATVAEVWLNGERILRSENMFHEHVIDVTDKLVSRASGADNELCIRFVALATALAQRRPRPRFKVRLVAQQQLRWIRGTLLGRIPGWTPPVAPVGPWRPVGIEQRSHLVVEDADLRARVEDRDGVVDAKLTVRRLGSSSASVEATLVVGEARSPLDACVEGDHVVLRGRCRLADVKLWWPHTHGEQPRYPARVELSVEGSLLVLDLGLVGFRTVAIDTEGDGFALLINGSRVFCRGVCATVADIVSLATSPEDHRSALVALRDAGANMIRVGGTMVYEDDTFYELCDELGILVWQDFMFANMDYPSSDEAFVASVRREAKQFLSRTQLSPSLAVLCGNSEGEQQAAMLGLEREQWSSPLFRDVLPAVASELRPDLPYWPSSASGGALPFHPSAGTSSYYGVGAYLRPLDDARRSDVRFTTECLAFANIPRDETIEAVLGDGQAPFHHPAWKARIPRDSGPGWDFEDVRDHYLASLFGVDPMRLRYADMDRYLAMSRVVTGEAIESAFAEWRRRGSRCGGALVWFHRDLWPGAGWGVVDAAGAPKAAYYAMKRVLQPVALVVTDEGLNGLALHAINETAGAREVTVTLKLYRHGESLVAEGATSLTLEPRAVVELSGDSILGRFTDLAYAYHFGPPGHDVAVATMICRSTNELLGEAFHFPLGRGVFSPVELGLEAQVGASRDDGSRELTVRARCFAQSVAIDARGFIASDDFFHVAPGGSRTVTLVPQTPRAAASSLRVLADQPSVGTLRSSVLADQPSVGTLGFRGSVRALNGRGPVRVTVAEPPARAPGDAE